MTDTRMRRYHDLLGFRLDETLTEAEETELAVMEWELNAKDLADKRERSAEHTARRSLERMRILGEEVDLYVAQWKAAR